MRIVIDNNSKELHDKLDKIGFCKLGWTTSTGKQNLRTCATDNYYTKDGVIPAYWNDGTGIEKFKNSDIIVCNTIEEFVNKARLMISVI